MTDGERDSVAVAGGGAWGCALAAHLAGKGERVSMWARRPEAARDRLEGVARLAASADPSLLAGAGVVVLAIPAQGLREALRRLAPSIGGDAILVNTAKGIEEDGGRLMDAVVEAEAPGRPHATLSGPSFAVDVMAGRPVAVAVASRDGAAGRDVANLFSTPRFRVYVTADVTGVQLGGACKNIVAIACGVAAGMGLGDSARAALLARGYAEMARLALAMGARESTLAGLAGLGDLVLTCTSRTSRNYEFGFGLGEGRSPEAAARAAGLAEGARTALAARALFARHDVEGPICEAVALVVEGRLAAAGAVERLLRRPPSSEAG